MLSRTIIRLLFLFILYTPMSMRLIFLSQKKSSKRKDDETTVDTNVIDELQNALREYQREKNQPRNQDSLREVQLNFIQKLQNLLYDKYNNINVLYFLNNNYIVIPNVILHELVFNMLLINIPAIVENHEHTRYQQQACQWINLFINYVQVCEPEDIKQLMPTYKQVCLYIDILNNFSDISEVSLASRFLNNFYEAFNNNQLSKTIYRNEIEEIVEKAQEIIFSKIQRQQSELDMLYEDDFQLMETISCKDSYFPLSLKNVQLFKLIEEQFRSYQEETQISVLQFISTFLMRVQLGAQDYQNQEILNIIIKIALLVIKECNYLYDHVYFGVHILIKVSAISSCNQEIISNINDLYEDFLFNNNFKIKSSLLQLISELIIQNEYKMWLTAYLINREFINQIEQMVKMHREQLQRQENFFQYAFNIIILLLDDTDGLQQFNNVYDNLELWMNPLLVNNFINSYWTNLKQYANYGY